MATQNYEYDPNSVTFVFAGVVAQQISQDGGIQFSRNSDMYTRQTAIDGITTRIKNNDFSGRFTITLQMSSPTNADFDALATADETEGKGVGPVFLRDASGTSLVTSAAGWIVKRPDLTFNNNLTDRTWVIECGYCQVAIGGSKYAV